MKIIIDVHGGDFAPQEVIKGAAMAQSCDKNLEIVFAGQKEIIEEQFKLCGGDFNRIEIIDCREIITNDDVPTTAIRSKKDSSLVRALAVLKERQDISGMVSAGSTGAVLTGATLITGRIKGISRPALAPVLPTVKDGHVLLIDCGANVDCKPQHLCDFALMGSAYMQSMHGIENPRVALLSNGVEEGKGNELNKIVFKDLQQLKGINFVGNMEARELLSGDYDVIVTDGFAGNIALKSVEGVASSVFALLKEEIFKTFKGKIGAMLLKESFKTLKSKLDYNQSGGAPFLGINKIIVKSHGASKAKSICASILQAKDMAGSGLVDRIAEKIASNTVTVGE